MTRLTKTRPKSYLLIDGPTKVAIPTDTRTLTLNDKRELADTLAAYGFWFGGEHFEVSDEMAREAVSMGKLVRELPEGTSVVEDLGMAV